MVIHKILSPSLFMTLHLPIVISISGIIWINRNRIFDVISQHGCICLTTLWLGFAYSGINRPWNTDSRFEIRISNGFPFAIKTQINPMWHTVGIQIGIVNGISMFAIGKKNQNNSLWFFSWNCNFKFTSSA